MLAASIFSVAWTPTTTPAAWRRSSACAPDACDLQLTRGIAPRRSRSPICAADPRDVDLLQSYLLRGAIQTQLHYHLEFKNEVASRWLESFLGHEHLGVKAVGGPTFRGLDDGLRCGWRDYLSTMLGSEPQTYEVRYKMGRWGGRGDTTDGAGWWPKRNDEARQEKAAADAPDAPPADTWSAASASRRSNPYLQQSTEEQYKTFKEQIEPRRVVNSLLSICNQLQGEWESDLLAIAREGGYILRVSAAAEAGEEEAFERAFGGAGGGGAGGDGDAAAAECAVGGDDDVAASSLCVDPAAILDAAAPLPAAITQAFRTQSSAWILDGVQEAPSPYRETWWDLLERATTREAARAAAAALERRGGAGDAVAAEWLRQKLAEWEPRFDAPPRAHLASIFLAEVCLAPAGPIARADGSLALAEPARVADELIVQRERVAKAWAAALAETGPGRASLLAADLEGQLNAPDAPS